MKFSWHEASLAQLYEIAFHDKECNPIYKQQALEEIERRRRKKQKHRRVNYMRKVVYPK